jgi:undecaprenyl-diphosphatase
VRTFLATLFLTMFLAARAAGAEPPASSPSAGPAAELSTTDAIILGVIEGVTEFLPISSTGHLIIGNRLLRLNSNEPLVGADGQPLWFKKPSAENPAGEPLTLRLAANTFAVVIQFGAIAAVALLYWTQIARMLAGLSGRDPEGRRMLGSLFIAFIPAAVLGLMLNDWIDAKLFSIGAVIVAQLAGAFLMFYAEWWRHRRAVAASMGTSPPLHGHLEKHALTELTPRSAAIIGVWQCLAMWPGMSRSMTTIVGGYFAGLDPRRAAEFSFLLGLVTLAGATALKSLKSGAAMIQVFGWSQVLLGALVAAVTAAICVRFLVHWLTRHGLTIFAWYRIVVAVILALYFRTELLS